MMERLETPAFGICDSCSRVTALTHFFASSSRSGGQYCQSCAAISNQESENAEKDRFRAVRKMQSRHAWGGIRNSIGKGGHGTH